MMQHRRSFLILVAVLPLLAATILSAGDPVTKTFNIAISDSVIRGQTTPAAAMIQVQPMSQLFAMVGGVRPAVQL
jgi:hypothetical protein